MCDLRRSAWSICFSGGECESLLLTSHSVHSVCLNLRNWHLCSRNHDPDCCCVEFLTVFALLRSQLFAEISIATSWLIFDWQLSKPSSRLRFNCTCHFYLSSSLGPVPRSWHPALNRNCLLSAFIYFKLVSYSWANANQFQTQSKSGWVVSFVHVSWGLYSSIAKILSLLVSLFFGSV